MSEFVSVPASLWNVESDIVDTILKELISREKLPYDFQFRALMIPKAERGNVAQQDIMAALGFGEPSNHCYLTNELPDCVYVPGTRPLRDVLTELETDYHQLDTVVGLTYSMDIAPHFAYGLWRSSIRSINPKLYDEVQTWTTPDGRRREFNQRYQLRHHLGCIVIRDSALLDLYNARQETNQQPTINHRLFQALLVDNHPTLAT